MGEKIPQEYSQVLKSVRQLKLNMPRPLVNLKTAAGGVSDLAVAVRALDLFHLWGECVYLSSSSQLKDTVVLDPSFLTKEVLSTIFRPDLLTLVKNGSSLTRISAKFGLPSTLFLKSCLF